MSDPLASLRGRIGAYALHAQGGTNTAPARAAFMGRFEIAVDPDGILPPAERARRAEAARKLYFAKLALKSAKARARNKKPPLRVNGRGGGATTNGGRSDDGTTNPSQ